MNDQPTTTHAPTKKQLASLSLLYRFRFATSDQLSKTLNIDKSTIRKRLKLMMELKYIGRKYEPDYHLLRKHASYYLLTDGTKVLKKLSSKRYPSAVLRNINQDYKASERFINHQLTIFDIYCTLRARYGDDLQLFTKTQLSGPTYFPKQLPDAYLQLGEGDSQKLFFFELFHESKRFFLATRRIMQYIDYAKQDKWPAKFIFPKILLVCDSQALQKRLVKRMQWTIEGIENEELKFFITNVDGLKNDKPWYDIADPGKAHSLMDIP